MWDVAFIVGAVLFFLITWEYVVACEHC